MDPTEQLIVASDPEILVDRLITLQDETGLTNENSTISLVGGLPLPIYDEELPRREAFHGLKAEHFWHPMFWIPQNYATRAPIYVNGEAVRIENDEEWVARILWSMQMCGLYDPETALFEDILATIGIDTRKNKDLQRVQAWLDGAADPLLDSFDPTDLWDQGDDDRVFQAYEEVQAAYNDYLFPMSRHICYDYVSSALAGLTVEARGFDALKLKSVLWQLTTFAALATWHTDDETLIEVIEQANANIEVAESTEQLLTWAINDLIVAIDARAKKYEAIITPVHEAMFGEDDTLKGQ